MRLGGIAWGALLAGLIGAAQGGWAQVAPDPYRADFEACVDQAQGADALRACRGQASDACRAREADGDTTLGIMFCTLMEHSLWDDRLNAVYGEQMELARMLDAKETKFGDASLAIMERSLRTAQRAWIPFRDAQCALEYVRWGAGSMRQIAGAACQLRMTSDRVINLMTGANAVARD